MNVVMVHYHLNRGGVTQVIRNHLKSLEESLTEPLSVLILYGGRHAAWSESLAKELSQVSVDLMALPELEYDAESERVGDTQQQATQLATVVQNTLSERNFTPAKTVLHIHNHSLGKNAALPLALREWSQVGYPILLQIHDFAEDFRPANYLHLQDALGEKQLTETLYPFNPRLHYAVLNGRDFELLQQAQVPAAQLHQLPNPVPTFGEFPDKRDCRDKLSDRYDIPSRARYLLYPVRGIRRKNLGEAILWTLLGDDNTWMGLTLEPMNPAERTQYEQWVELSDRLELRCRFDVGGETGLGFLENLSAADALLTTSIAEGFGMVFLESALTHRPLIGRDLPQITRDFKTQGLRFPGLVPAINIPLKWLDKAQVFPVLKTAFESLLKDYMQPPPDPTVLERELAELTCDGQIDFAFLNAETQRQIVKRVAECAADREALREHNPQAMQALQWAFTAPEHDIAQNQRMVEQHYSVQAIGDRLLSLYRSLLNSESDGGWGSLPAADSILASFLSLDKLHPIRLEP